MDYQKKKTEIPPAHIENTSIKKTILFAGLLRTASPPSRRVDAKNIKICRCAMERVGFTS